MAFIWLSTIPSCPRSVAKSVTFPIHYPTWHQSPVKWMRRWFWSELDLYLVRHCFLFDTSDYNRPLHSLCLLPLLPYCGRPLQVFPCILTSSLQCHGRLTRSGLEFGVSVSGVLLLTFARTFVLDSRTRGNHDHGLLSQDSDWAVSSCWVEFGLIDWMLNFCWSSPAQLLLVPILTGLVIICYSLTALEAFRKPSKSLVWRATL